MTTLTGLLLAWATVLLISAVPAFMPPTPVVLAVFYIQGDLPLLPLVIGGATMTALGRLGLVLLSRRFSHLLSPTTRANAEALCEVIAHHPRRRDLIVLAFTVGPLPSNALFIAAGLGGAPLWPVLLLFWPGRMVADTIWLWTGGEVYRGLQAAFLDEMALWQAAVTQIVAAALLLIVVRLPWMRWFGAAPAGHLPVAGDGRAAEPAGADGPAERAREPRE